MRKAILIFMLILIFLLVLLTITTEARRGCCSHHGGVCCAGPGCDCYCCDGTPLSAKCAPYYPACSSQPALPPPAPTPPSTQPIISEPDFTFPSMIYHVGDRVLLDASSCAGSGNTLQWDFGADGTIDATGIRVYYAISHSGMNLIKLTVITPSGESNSITKGIRALPSPHHFPWLLVLLVGGLVAAGIAVYLINK